MPDLSARPSMVQPMHSNLAPRITSSMALNNTWCARDGLSTISTTKSSNCPCVLNLRHRRLRQLCRHPGRRHSSRNTGRGGRGRSIRGESPLQVALAKNNCLNALSLQLPQEAERDEHVRFTMAPVFKNSDSHIDDFYRFGIDRLMCECVHTVQRLLL